MILLINLLNTNANILWYAKEIGSHSDIPDISFPIYNDDINSLKKVFIDLSDIGKSRSKLK